MHQRRLYMARVRKNAGGGGEPALTNVFSFSGDGDGVTLESRNASWDGNSTGYAVTSGALRPTNGYVDTPAFFSATTASDQAVEATRLAGTMSAYIYWQLYLQRNGSQLGYHVDVAESNIAVLRDGSNLGITTAHGVDQNTTDLTVKVTLVSGRLRIYVNGSSTPLIDYTDGSPITGGSPAYGCYANGAPANMSVSSLKCS